MNNLEKFVPLATAIISAAALLGGYTYQKNKEKEAEIRKTRQEIYSRLITNITKRAEFLDRIEMLPEWKKARSYEEQYLVAIKDPELSKNISDQKEIAAFLCLYGTDDAIKAYVNYLEEGFALTSARHPAAEGPELGTLILALRKSIYEETSITSGESNLAIWNDIESFKKLKKLSQTK
jgi:hypothetical protein